MPATYVLARVTDLYVRVERRAVARVPVPRHKVARAHRLPELHLQAATLQVLDEDCWGFTSEGPSPRPGGRSSPLVHQVYIDGMGRPERIGAVTGNAVG